MDAFNRKNLLVPPVCEESRELTTRRERDVTEPFPNRYTKPAKFFADVAMKGKSDTDEVSFVGGKGIKVSPSRQDREREHMTTGKGKNPGQRKGFLLRDGYGIIPTSGLLNGRGPIVQKGEREGSGGHKGMPINEKQQEKRNITPIIQQRKEEKGGEKKQSGS